MRAVLFLSLVQAAILLTGCRQTEKSNTSLEQIAGSDEALAFMKAFEGRGVLSDSSQATPPKDALAEFNVAEDLAIDLVLSEPEVTQPVFMTFDHRGRLWVVQYNQYPYPEGLKVLSMDQHIRAQYDKIPQPPPAGVKGADKITFFEDTDGDGTFERSTDAITGLNIATSVAFGRGKIWVTDPPYLLAYPDEDDNGIPDGAPTVELKGFGIEDTHAVANNLRWGPDGWLYGAQGSTCTSNVSSDVSKNVKFDGQAIWRYHPGSHVFEVFAEGGGNTFDVEIDDKGRIYSGDNGVTRGRYYKQGAYHVRNLGKHGAFTNPYALGFLRDMKLTGEEIRFTHAFVRYQEQSLPQRYHDRMIAINPMQSFVQCSRFAPSGSTFSVTDEDRILRTKDHWFRPVDITTGPDGAVYICDWYDSRLSHVDPRDTWSKSTGRIYRLRNRSVPAGFSKFNLKQLSAEELVKTISNPDRWYRQAALTEISDRKDTVLIRPLTQQLLSGDGQPALEALWAIHAIEGTKDDVMLTALRHRDPFVRMWAVRLIGDTKTPSAATAHELSALAAREQHPEVRSQLAATAKRLPGDMAISIVGSLLKSDDSNDHDPEDPDIPLQLWWALESKSITNKEAVVGLFSDRSLWSMEIVSETILPRLMQRWIMEGDAASFDACAKLARLAPSQPLAKPLMDGIEEGLRGKDVADLSPKLVEALKPFQSHYEKQTLAVSLRRGDQQSVNRALQLAADERAPIGERFSYIRIFGEVDQPSAVPVLIRLMEGSQSSPGIRQAALEALARYDDPAIGTRVVSAYPDILRADPDVRMAALSLLSLRTTWATKLLDAIDRETKPGEKFIAHSIDRNDVPASISRQLILLGDPGITRIVTRLWPDVTPASTQQKSVRINEIIAILKSGKGDAAKGKAIFATRCGSCHRLFNEGGVIGPDLTGYDRRNVDEMLTNIVDPNAYIREGYVAYHITTSDNRNLLGTLKSRDGSTITLQPLNGEVVVLNADQISRMEEQKISVMPEGLLNGLSPQEIRDITSYLTRDAGE